MPEPKDVTQTTNFKGFTHKECEFYPCHDITQFKRPNEYNCMFCNCPLYWLKCPGTYTVIESGGIKRKDCTLCFLPHDGYVKSWNLMNLSSYQKNPEYWDGT